jgi:hypothetical protein
MPAWHLEGFPTTRVRFLSFSGVYACTCKSCRAYPDLWQVGGIMLYCSVWGLVVFPVSTYKECLPGLQTSAHMTSLLIASYTTANLHHCSLQLKISVSSAAMTSLPWRLWRDVSDLVACECSSINCVHAYALVYRKRCCIWKERIYKRYIDRRCG